MACVDVHGTLGAGVREGYSLTKHTCIATYRLWGECLHDIGMLNIKGLCLTGKISPPSFWYHLLGRV